MFPVDDIEFCLDGFIVGDALGIGTLHYAEYAVRKHYFSFFRNLIVTDYVYFSFRGDYSNAVERVFVKLHIADFDYAFLAELAALEIVADGNSRLKILYAQNSYRLEQR